jgi:hypothetical protein
MRKGVKFPKEEVIQFIIRKVIRKQREVNSQRELAELVNKNLRMVEPHYTISPRRVRLISIRLPDVKVKVQTKRGKIRKKCPSCLHSLKRVYTKNLKGKRILFKLVCPKCSYQGLNGKWVPRRYSFVRK